MDGYEVDEALLYSSPDGLVKAFKGRSKDSRNLSIILVSHELVRDALQAQFSEVVDAILNTGLEQARGNKILCKLEEIRIDLSGAPTRYALFHVMNPGEEGGSGDTELQKYMELTAAKMAAAALQKPEGANKEGESYEMQTKSFYTNDFGTVNLYRGISGLIIVKRHEISEFRRMDINKDLVQAINSGVEQARVEHPHSCRILAMHLDLTEAPEAYFLDHILEALDRDVGKEIKLRKGEQRPFSESELWDFLLQTASALAYAHKNNVAHRDIKPENIFIDSQSKYKIGDFGCYFVRRVGTRASTLTGTESYMSPEQRQTECGLIESYSAFKADVFALGMTLFALTILNKPEQWPLPSFEQKARAKILSLPYSPTIKQLILEMVAIKEANRPSMKTVLECAEIEATKPVVLQARMTGNYEDALQTLQHIRASLCELASAETALELGAVLSHFGRWSEARAVLAEGLQSQPSAELTLRLNNVLAETHFQAGEWTDTIPVCERTLSQGEQVSTFEQLRALYYLSHSYYSLGSGQGGEMVRKWGKIMVEATPNNKCLSLLITAGRLKIEGNKEEALRCYQEGLEIARQLFSHCLFTASSLGDLALLYESIYSLQEAEHAYVNCRELCQIHFPYSRTLALCLDHIGFIYKNANRLEEGRQAWQQCNDLSKFSSLGSNCHSVIGILT